MFVFYYENSLMIEYNGELYRDDRLFVINLTYGKLKNDLTRKTVSRWTLITYRNTKQLTYTKSDFFENKGAAKEYLRDVEPKCPLISNDEKPLVIPNGQNTWLYWNRWLKENNLFSAMSEKQNVPFWQDPRGYNYVKNYYTKILMDPSI